MGSGLAICLPLWSVVDSWSPVVRGPIAAPVGGMRRPGRGLGNWAARIKLTVGSRAPSASAQEAADQPKPNRYDHDVGEQRCLRYLGRVLLGCQRMSPIRPGPRTHCPVNELLADERDGEAMLQPLIGRASWNAARQEQRTEYEEGSQRPQHDDALHWSTLRPTERCNEPRLSTRAHWGHGRRGRTWLRRCGDGRQLGLWWGPSPVTTSLVGKRSAGVRGRGVRLGVPGYSSSNGGWRSQRDEMETVPCSRNVRAACRASSRLTRWRCGVGVSCPPSRRGCQPRSDGSPSMS
jgi:hypothetical protein